MLLQLLNQDAQMPVVLGIVEVELANALVPPVMVLGMRSR